MFLLSLNSHSSEFGLSYGLGVSNSAKYSVAETKTADLAYRGFLIPGVYWQARTGFWGDGSRDPSRRSSYYASTGPGIEVDLKPLEVRSGWGLAYITTPDSYLGGHTPQFNGDLYVGLRDKNNMGLGMRYSHLSSAGLILPNKGRDFVTVEIGVKW